MLILVTTITNIVKMDRRMLEKTRSSNVLDFRFYILYFIIQGHLIVKSTIPLVIMTTYR